jgi:heme A synthase
MCAASDKHSSTSSARWRCPSIQRLAITLGALFLAQLVAGMINLGLLAPVWMQLFHLLLADALWIVLVLFGAEILRQTTVHAPARKAVMTQRA